MVNWSKLFAAKPTAVKEFAAGNLSRDRFYSEFTNTELGGEVRSLLRTRRVRVARELARKAVKRRS